MRKLSVALFLWLAFFGTAWAENTVGPSAQILCNKVANVAIGPTTATQIVAGVAGQSIFICGYQVTTNSTAGTFTFIFGTGSTCTTPTAPYDGQILQLATDTTLTGNVTVTPATGQTLQTVFSSQTLTPGTSVEWVYTIGTTKWQRLR